MNDADRLTPDQAIRLVIVGLAAWVIPGAGHWLIRERKRAVIIFVTITALFISGLYIGSIGIVDRVGARIHYIGQMLYSPVTGVIGQIVQNSKAKTTDDAGNLIDKKAYESYGRPCDTGQIYTAVAGLLNLLCILSAVYMAYCGRGEMIGRDEDETGRPISEEVPHD